MRSAGVLLPIFCLPSKYGIGTLGSESYRFIDFLYRAGMKYWQILPLTPTGVGNSPYQSVSAFAGNPYFIDLEDAASYLSVSLPEMQIEDATESNRIDYGRLFHEREKILRFLFLKSAGIESNDEYKRFLNEEEDWLTDYAFFMAYRKKYAGKAWQEWPREINRTEEDCKEAEFHRFVQFLFFNQYEKIRQYAQERGVGIIGDMPLYVSLDSADVFANRELFLLDENGYPYEVAGVPPDLFSSDGQRWGNPLYAWERMEKDEFSWWKKRIKHHLKMCDKVRIDHFIGLVNYYAIPASAETARDGVWRRALGEELLQSLGDTVYSLIAEDLGVVHAEVERVRDRFSLPGMKVLQFAFNGGSGNPFLPHAYHKNCVVYAGTHDNETLLGYFSNASEEELSFACRYLGVETKNPALAAKATVRAGFASVGDTVIMPLQDLMGLDNHARVNTPSTVDGNWEYRLPYDWEKQLEAERLKEIVSLYGRL